MNEKVQAAFSSAHYNARTPILHSFHLSWHLGTFILFKGLTLVKIKNPVIFVQEFEFCRIIFLALFFKLKHIEFLCLWGILKWMMIYFAIVFLFGMFGWRWKKLFSQRSTNTSVIINRQTCIFSISYLMVRF